MPLRLTSGWNQLQLNLAEFTQRAYGTNYMETVRVTIHANCRLRNVYFSDRLYTEEEKPAAFKFISTSEKKSQKEEVLLPQTQSINLETIRPPTEVSVDEVSAQT